MRKTDPFRPGYHITPPSGWMNDPNGLIHYNGIYHVFYQHYPYKPEWGPMHWAHVTSNDLIHWKHEDIALSPDQVYDSHPEMGGCFSGSAIEQNGTLFLLYTACVKGHSPYQVQALALSEDGVHFQKYSENPIINSPPINSSQEFRDPKVWKKDDIYYCVIGSSNNNNGQVLLYRSSNLFDWDYLGVIAQSNGKQGNMWECPDLITFPNSDVLLFSPIEAEIGKTYYLSGQLNYQNAELSYNKEGQIDYGPDFYAPQTFLAPDGRRLMIGWLCSWNSKYPTKPYGWAGQLSIPRKIWTDNSGVLHQAPIEELQALRGYYRNINLTCENTITSIGKVKANRYELLIRTCSNTPTEFGLHLCCSDTLSQKTVILVNSKNNTVTVDCTQSGIGKKNKWIAPIKCEPDGGYLLHIFVDSISIEIFTSQYEIAMSTTIYPDPSSTGLNFFSKSSSTGNISLDLWELDDVFASEPML